MRWQIRSPAMPREPHDNSRRQRPAFGAAHPLEIQLAELVRAAVPSMQRVRFVNSGTEATMSAIRLARAYTRRSLIVKFDGHYHGHADTTYDASDSRVRSAPFNDGD